MNGSLISIIMPVYNAEKTISRVLDSIIAQSLTDWELICIDDGSKDSSGVILDEYAKHDGRIRVIHKNNEGVSAARQDGLDASKGKFIIHADADDWVEPTMLEDMYEKITKDDCDVVFCDFFLNKGTDQKYISQHSTSLESRQLIDDFFGKLCGSCWNKLVKKACVDKYNVQFPKGVNYCEDLLFWISLFKNNDVKVSYLPKAYYHYVENKESITHNITYETYNEYSRFAQCLQDLLPEKEYSQYIEKLRLSSFLMGFRADLFNDEEIIEMFKPIRKFAFSTSCMRWKIGYLFIWIRCYSVARYFLKY